MRRRILSLHLWTSCALFACSALVVAQESVEREWTVRRWARQVFEQTGELARAVRDADWEVRHAAFEALTRAADAELSDELRDAVRETLADPHPNVRAAALAAAGRHNIELDADALRALALDTWPGVRHELARHFARDPFAFGREELLAQLVRDADAAVARTARDAMWTSAFHELAPPDDLAESLSTAELLHGLSVLARGAPDARWFAELRATAAGDAARLAWIEAVEVLRDERTHAPDLARGWLLSAGEHESAAQALKHAAAAAVGRRAGAAPTNGEQPDLAVELARRLRVEELQPVDAFALIEGALLAAGSAPSRVANELRSAPKDAVLAWWSGIGLSARRWDSDALVDWENHASSDVRATVLEALAQTFLRSGDAASAAVLVRALDADPRELRGVAFKALAQAADPAPFAEALAASWAREELATQLDRLRRLPRGVAWRTFEPALVELWESGRAREPVVLELLRDLGPDAQLAARVASWFEAQLATVEAERGDTLADNTETDDTETNDTETDATDFAPRGERPRETLDEGHAQDLVQAYAALAGEHAADRLTAWLERAEPVSIEVAKVIAHALGRSSAGRARLEQWLEPERRSRLRVEAALGLLGESAPKLDVEADATLVRRATNILLERLPHCDQPLRARTLEALGGYGALDAVRARPIAVALGGSDVAERMQALANLARGAKGSVELERALSEVLQRSRDLDVRRLALEALGQSGGPVARAALDELVTTEHLEDLLLPSLASLADPPPIEDEVLGAPRSAARAELEARFVGKRLATREFVYRGELEAAVRFAQAGRLEGVLGSHAWWELDARWNLLLGERLLRSERADVHARGVELVRAGLVGLEGEGTAQDREQLVVSARALLARVAFASERPSDAEPHVGELLLAWRLGELGPRQLFGPLGPNAPDLGRDPVAWLEASVLQARAHAAFEQGDFTRARELAEAAKAALGASDRAQSQQRRLAEILGD